MRGGQPPVDRVPGQQGRSPASREDRALHARLLAGDPTAPADLALAHLASLTGWVLDRFPRQDPHLLESAAIDLLLALAERPRQYDPEKLGLAAYLRMAVRRDVQNALRRPRRHEALEAVELAQRAGNRLVDGPPDPADVVARAEPLGADSLALVRASFDDTDWAAVQLMLAGERRTAAYARLMGLAELSELERARAVKRLKDRLQKRLQRLAPRIPRDG